MTRGDLLESFMSGAILMGYCVCGLFFLRFWLTTRDRLFAIFSVAFWILGFQRLGLALSEPVEEWRTGLYVVRLLAFLLILGAIIDKNRARTGSPAPPDRATTDQRRVDHP